MPQNFGEKILLSVLNRVFMRFPDLLLHEANRLHLAVVCSHAIFFCSYRVLTSTVSLLFKIPQLAQENR